MIKYFALFSALVILLSFSGCEIININDIEETTESSTETDITPQPFPLTIGGVLIEEPPQKVVCLSPALMEILYEMGYGSVIIGRGKYCDYPPTAKSAPDLGSSADPNLEAIKGLKPDIVLTASPIADKDLFWLEQNNIKVIMIPSPNNLTEFLSVYQAVGLMFEGMFTGKEKGESYFSDISKACDNREVVDIGNFIYITENFGIATGDTLESAVLSCFGVNQAEEYKNYDFDPSLLLENQPDIIIINKKYSAESIKAHEHFSSLDAVQNDRFIFIDNAYFERPSARIVEMLRIFLDDYRKLK